MIDKYKGADYLDDLQRHALFYSQNVDFVLNDYFFSEDYTTLKSEFEKTYPQAQSETVALRAQCFDSILRFRQSALCKACVPDNSDIVDSTTSNLRITSNVCLTVTNSCKKIWRHRFQIIQAAKLVNVLLSDGMSLRPAMIEYNSSIDYSTPKFVEVLSHIVTLDTIKFEQNIAFICENFLYHDFDAADKFTEANMTNLLGNFI